MVVAVRSAVVGTQRLGRDLVANTDNVGHHAASEREKASLPLACVVSARREVGDVIRRVTHDVVSVARADADSVLGERGRSHRLESDNESKRVQTPSLRRFRRR